MAVTSEQVLDETSPTIDLAAGCASVALENPRGVPVDGAAVRERLRGARHADSIRKLRIGWTSQLSDLSVLEALPDIEVVLVQGSRIATLAGVEAVRHGKLLEVQTGSNKKRRLDAMRDARFDTLQVFYAHRTDLVAIGSSRAAREVVIAKAPAVDFALWEGLRIETLQVNACPLKVLEDCARVPTLWKLVLVNCKAIERFAGDCGTIRWAMIDASKALDIGSLGALSGIESLTITLAGLTRVSAFFELRHLKSLTLWSGRSGRLELDDRALERALPALESFGYTADSMDDARTLSAENPRLLVSAGQRSFRNGAPAAG